MTENTKKAFAPYSRNPEVLVFQTPEGMSRAFIEAATHGHTRTLRSLIDEFEKVAPPDLLERALVAAIVGEGVGLGWVNPPDRAGHYECVEMLLDRGVPLTDRKVQAPWVTGMGGPDRSPMEMVAVCRNADTVSMVLGRGLGSEKDLEAMIDCARQDKQPQKEALVRWHQLRRGWKVGATP